jgi:hypothetical protein
MPTKTVAPTVLSACVLSLSVVNLQLFGNSTALALVVQKTFSSLMVDSPNS